MRFFALSRQIGTALLGVAITIAAALPLVAVAGPNEQAKRMHDRIAGVPPDATTLATMAGMVTTDPLGAALIATDSPDFYRVTLKNFSAPWTNRDRSVFVPLDDYIATIIGMVRDNVDFREILSGDILYVGTATPGYSTTSNAHYEALEAQGTDLQADLQARTQSAVTGIPASATAGIITTRSAAKAFFIDGTNRAMFRFTMLNHLCLDMEQVKDVSTLR